MLTIMATNLVLILLRFKLSQLVFYPNMLTESSYQVLFNTKKTDIQLPSWLYDDDSTNIYLFNVNNGTSEQGEKSVRS